MLDRNTGGWGADAGREQGRRAADVRGIILRLAAYRAIHDGREPPPNSVLSREKEFLLALTARPSRWRRLLRPFGSRHGRSGGNRPQYRPLNAYLVQRAFLIDDYSEEDVVRRLEAWPMISAYRPEGRIDTGEWFIYTMQVRAETPRQARFLVDCIFAVELPDASGGMELNLPGA